MAVRRAGLYCGNTGVNIWAGTYWQTLSRREEIGRRRIPLMERGDEDPNGNPGNEMS